jgi:hypothetical protein
VDAWLAHPAVRPFIRVNAWEGVEWFHRESWDELLAWVERLDGILVPETTAGAIVRELGGAAETTGYRVDLLREALGAVPGAEAGAVPRAEPGAEAEDATAPTAPRAAKPKAKDAKAPKADRPKTRKAKKGK